MHFEALAMAEEEIIPEPHALLISFPMQGHINPMLQLAFQLRRLGFSVTLATSDRFSSFKDLAGINLLVHSDPHIDEKNIYEFAESDQSVIREPVEKFVQEICSGGQEQRALSCIIFNTACLSWVPDLGERLHIPCVAFVSVSICALHLFANLLLVHSQLSTEQRIQIPGLLPLSLNDIPEMMRTRCSSPVEVEKMLERMKKLHNVKWMLINSFQELEKDAFEASKSSALIPVGPLLPFSDLKSSASSLEEDSSCLEWLDKQIPYSVIYVSFGSMSTMSVHQAEELVKGLEASNQPFLWVWRPRFVEDVSDSYLQNLKKRFENQGMIISWAPQLQVLGHKSVGGFLTHGGWNSVLESISMGVPMLCWPCRAEQHLNCKYVVDGWKIGVRISKDGLIEKEEICALINMVMKEDGGNGMRRNVMDLRDLARRSISHGGSSITNLNEFKRAMVCPPQL